MFPLSIVRARSQSQKYREKVRSARIHSSRTNVHIINEMFWRATQAWKLNDTIQIREKGLNSASGLTKPIISQYLE